MVWIIRIFGYNYDKYDFSMVKSLTEANHSREPDIYATRRSPLNNEVSMFLFDCCTLNDISDSHLAVIYTQSNFQFDLQWIK